VFSLKFCFVHVLNNEFHDQQFCNEELEIAHGEGNARREGKWAIGNGCMEGWASTHLSTVDKFILNWEGFTAMEAHAKTKLRSFENLDGFH